MFLRCVPAVHHAPSWTNRNAVPAQAEKITQPWRFREPSGRPDAMEKTAGLGKRKKCKGETLLVIPDGIIGWEEKP
jgi:hypothetical protein